MAWGIFNVTTPKKVTNNNDRNRTGEREALLERLRKLQNQHLEQTSHLMQCERMHPDPNCDKGIPSLNGKVCCPASCERCSGTFCKTRPGGASNCCSHSILESNRSCLDSPAPCKIPIETADEGEFKDVFEKFKAGTDLDLLDEHVGSWFLQPLTKMKLSEWTVADVHAFFVEEDEPELARECLENDVNGEMLYEVFKPMGDLTFFLSATHFLSFRDKSHWLDNKLDLWDEMMQRANNKERERDQYESAKECSTCNGLALEWQWGVEWKIFPVPNPWPNPIHSFSCVRTDFSSVNSVHDADSKADLQDDMTRKVTKWVKRNKASVFKSFGKYFSNVGEAIEECSLCAFCILHKKYRRMIDSMKAKAKQARRWLLASATNKERNLLWEHFHSGFRESLVQVLEQVRHSNGHDTRIGDWAQQYVPITDPGGSHRAFTDEEINNHFEHFSKQMEIAEHALADAQQKSRQRLGNTIEDFEYKQGFSLIRNRTQSRQTNSTKWSVARNGTTLIELLAGPPVIIDDIIPEDCMDVLNPKTGGLKKFYTNFQVVLNIEQPNIGEFLKDLVKLQLFSAVENLMPELLVSLSPIKPTLKHCLEVPAQIQHSLATTCTVKHKGMCLLAAKKRLFEEMIAGSWPPLQSTWNQRRVWIRSLKRAVRHSCLLVGDGKRKAEAIYLDGKNAIRDEEGEDRFLEHKDCETIKKEIETIDSAAGEGINSKVPIRTPLVWHAAIQVWAARKRVEMQKTMGDKALRLSALNDEPNVDPLLYAFCAEEVLGCPVDSQNAERTWSNFVMMKGHKEWSDDQRQAMERFWEEVKDKDAPLWTDEDRRAIANLGEVYKAHIKPEMDAKMYLSQNDPFGDTAHQTSRRVLWWDTALPGRTLEDPAKTAKLRKGRPQHKIVWMDSSEDCSTLHVVPDCDFSACKGCGTQALYFPLKPQAFTPKDPATVLCPKYSKKQMQECRQCLEEQRTPNILHILQCHREPQFGNLYDYDHPVQKYRQSKGLNRFIVLQGMFTNVPQRTKRGKLVKKGNSLLRAIFLSPVDDSHKELSGYARVVAMQSFFSSIQEHGDCKCSCRVIAQHQLPVTCHKWFMVHPQEKRNSIWCMLPTRYNVAGAMCCDNAHQKLTMVCSGMRNLTYEAASRFCLNQNKRLCTSSLLSRHYSSIHANYGNNKSCNLETPSWTEESALVSSQSFGEVVDSGQFAWERDQCQKSVTKSKL